MQKGEEFFETLSKLYANNLAPGGVIQLTSTFDTEGKKEKTIKKGMTQFKKNIGADEVFYIEKAGMRGASSLFIQKNEEKNERQKS